MLGSHLAERLVHEGRRVRALVRVGSKTEFLDALGVEIVRGDLTDSLACDRAVQGVEVVYHAAAKVGDWGRWSDFQAGCVDATRNLGEASARSGARRFLHVSSTSAYGHPAEGGPPIVEDAAMGRNLWVWDDYTRSKVESERILWGLVDSQRLPLTVIRPSWLFGERDRTTTARLMQRLREGRVPCIGPGDNPLSAVYVGTVADAAILAARHPDALRESYNITSQGPITQRDFLNLFARACGAPEIRKSVPYRLTFAAALLLEAQGRLLRQSSPPLITRYATWLMGRNLSYSTEKAERQLGWRPRLTYPESIERTVQWFLARESS